MVFPGGSKKRPNPLIYTHDDSAYGRVNDGTRRSLLYNRSSNAHDSEPAAYNDYGSFMGSPINHTTEFGAMRPMHSMHSMHSMHPSFTGNKRRKLDRMDDVERERVNSLESTIKQDHETITSMKKENNKLSISLESHKQQVKNLEQQLIQLQQQTANDSNNPKDTKDSLPEINAVNTFQDDKTCVVCMDNDKNHVIVPCGHACLCGECADLFKNSEQKCPLCKADIMTITKIFF